MANNELLKEIADIVREATQNMEAKLEARDQRIARANKLLATALGELRGMNDWTFKTQGVYSGETIIRDIEEYLNE